MIRKILYFSLVGMLFMLFCTICWLVFMVNGRLLTQIELFSLKIIGGTSMVIILACLLEDLFLKN